MAKDRFTLSTQRYLRCGTDHACVHLTANLPKANLLKIKLSVKLHDNRKHVGSKSSSLRHKFQGKKVENELYFKFYANIYLEKKTN